MFYIITLVAFLLVLHIAVRNHGNANRLTRKVSTVYTPYAGELGMSLLSYTCMWVQVNLLHHTRDLNQDTRWSLGILWYF